MSWNFKLYLTRYPIDYVAIFYDTVITKDVTRQYQNEYISLYFMF